MANKKAIIFNSPPLSGKDVAAEHIVNYLSSKGIPAYHKEVKENLFKATKACFGVPDDVWEELYKRENKELPSYYLVNNGTPFSPREAMINTSENVLKPLFGKDVFGIMAAKSLEDGVNIFSDGGFPEEVQCILDEVGVDNFMLVHVIREGCSFEGDSRNYVTGFPNTVTLYNDGTLEEYLNECINLVENL